MVAKYWFESTFFDFGGGVSPVDMAASAVIVSNARFTLRPCRGRVGEWPHGRGFGMSAQIMLGDCATSVVRERRRT